MMTGRAGHTITLLTDVRLITCIVQRGLGDIIVNAAQEAGAQGATIFYAKGSGVRERLGILGVAVEVEKEVVNIVVSSEQLETVFNNIYLAGQLDTPGMGFMYVTPLEKAATYIPEELLKQLERQHPGDFT
jgi:nitrogen regulatory protein PII